MSLFRHPGISFKRRTNGFSLIELAIVVAIIAILAAMAVPAYKLIQDRSRRSAFESDLRAYEQAFDIYAMEVEEYPATQLTSGVLPSGMAGRLGNTWTQASPIGGVYRWVYTTETDPTKRSAYIELVPSAQFPIRIEASSLEKIDAEIDNGSLSTGDLQLVASNVRYYLKQ